MRGKLIGCKSAGGKLLLHHTSAAELSAPKATTGVPMSVQGRLLNAMSCSILVQGLSQNVPR